MMSSHFEIDLVNKKCDFETFDVITPKTNRTYPMGEYVCHEDIFKKYVESKKMNGTKNINQIERFKRRLNFEKKSKED